MTAKSDTVTITLTGQRPVRVLKREWPIVASAEEGASRLHVRRHADGRAIVCGANPGYRAGRMLAAGDDLIATIRFVANELGLPILAQRAVAKLPPVDLAARRPRTVAFIPVDALVEGRGYRVSLVVEGEAGHHPTGTWPYTGAPGETLPWFWGADYDEARRLADEYNARAGVSKIEALEIVARSMARSLREDGAA